MAQKSYNVNPSETELTVVISPDDTDVDVSAGANQSFTIVVARDSALSDSNQGVRNLTAKIDEALGTVDLPKLTGGDLYDSGSPANSKYKLIRDSNSTQVTPVTFSISKIEGSNDADNTTGNETQADLTWTNLNFSIANKKIVKLSGQVPKFIRFTLVCNPFGSSSSTMAAGEKYNYELQSSLDSETYTFVNSLTFEDDEVAS